MFNYFTSITKAVVDTVIPLMRTNNEQLIYIWNSIELTYQKSLILSETDSKYDIFRETNLNELFGNFVQVLICDEIEYEKSLMNSDLKEIPENFLSPCVKYFIENGLIDKLCALGLANTPFGMRFLITKTLEAIFANLNPSIFVNMTYNNHLALRQFVNICFEKGDIDNINSRETYLSLILTLSNHFKSDRSIINIFYVDGSDSFPMFAALLKLLHSEGDQGIIVRKAVLNCIQSSSTGVLTYVMQKTDFTAYILFGWMSKYLHLIERIKSEEVLNSLNWIEDEGIKKIINSLVLWQSFINSIFKTSSKSLVAEILLDLWLKECYHKLFIDLSSDNNMSIVIASHCLHLLIENYASNNFTSKIIEILIKAKAFNSEELIIQRLFKRLNYTPTCSKHDQWLILSTYKLLESIVGLKSPDIILSLCGKEIFDGTFIEESSKKLFLNTKELSFIRIADIMSPFPTFKYLIKFENLEPYLLDAQNEGQLWFSLWDTWLNNLRMDILSDEKDELNLTELTLISSLFDCLLNFHTNPFAINLALTGLLAKICYCPHPLIHSYLLDPMISFDITQRSLFRIMRHLYDKGMAKQATISDYSDRLEAVRSFLSSGNSNLDVDADNELMLFIQSQIVFEEFLKELVSITQAKMNIQNSLIKLHNNVTLIVKTSNPASPRK